MLLGVHDDTQNLLGSGKAFRLIPRPTLPYIILNVIDGLIATLQHEMICLTCYCCVLTVADYGSVLRGAILHFKMNLRHLCVYWHIFYSSTHGQLPCNVSEVKHSGPSTHIYPGTLPLHFTYHLQKFSFPVYHHHYFSRGPKTIASITTTIHRLRNLTYCQSDQAEQ